MFQVDKVGQRFKSKNPYTPRVQGVSQGNPGGKSRLFSGARETNMPTLSRGRSQDLKKGGLSGGRVSGARNAPIF